MIVDRRPLTIDDDGRRSMVIGHPKLNKYPRQSTSYIAKDSAFDVLLFQF